MTDIYFSLMYHKKWAFKLYFVYFGCKLILEDFTMKQEIT